MNYHGVTKSNYVEVENKEALQHLVDLVKKHDVSWFSTYWEGEKFAIGSQDSPIYVEEERLDEFLTFLGRCIADPMVIRSVGHEGMRHVPDAWQWIVYPDGTWEHESLTDHRDL